MMIDDNDNDDDHGMQGNAHSQCSLQGTFFLPNSEVSKLHTSEFGKKNVPSHHMK